MKKAEKILAIVSILALGMNLLLIPFGGVLTVLSLSAISVLYMYLSIALFNGIPFRGIFDRSSYSQVSKMRLLGAVGTGLALSMTTVGILFKVQSWPGATFNLGLGLIGLLPVTLIGTIRFLKSNSSYYKNIFKRVVVIGGLGLFVMLMPKATWIEIKYRNYPGYLEAFKKVMENPGNKDYTDRLEAERRKMLDARSK